MKTIAVRKAGAIRLTSTAGSTYCAGTGTGTGGSTGGSLGGLGGSGT